MTAPEREQEKMRRQLGGPAMSFEVGITDFVAAADKAYLSGFAVINGRRHMIRETSLIKEPTPWKSYGNRRAPAP